MNRNLQDAGADEPPGGYAVTACAIHFTDNILKWSIVNNEMPFGIEVKVRAKNIRTGLGVGSLGDEAAC